jgi:hypothetical protein
MMRTFVDGENRTLSFVREIESQVAAELEEGEGFVDPETFADLEVALASFFPGGGEYLWDEHGLSSLFRYILLENGIAPGAAAHDSLNSG